MSAKTQKPPETSDADYLSTGITPLNLGIHGRTTGGLIKGRIYRFMGRPSGGKTVVCRQILAEAARNKNFDEYELVYDDPERGVNFKDEVFFPVLVGRVRPAGYSKGHKPKPSRTVVDFFSRIKAMLKAGKKVVWVEDSLDALEGSMETKMGDGKAKYYSQELRRLMEPIDQSGSILILVSQARANMGAGMFEDEDTTAGGRALEHYPTVEVQLRKARTLRKDVNGVSHPIGAVMRAKVKKNRIGGAEPTVFFPFFRRKGIDDAGACAMYLLAEKHWKYIKVDGEEYDNEEDPRDKDNKAFAAPEFDFEGRPDKFRDLIYGKGMLRDLQILTGKVWQGIEDALTPSWGTTYER